MVYKILSVRCGSYWKSLEGNDTDMNQWIAYNDAYMSMWRSKICH